MTGFPQHILMTADAVGGVWTYALELTRALAGHGVQVSIATLGPTPSRSQQRDLARLPNASLHLGHHRLEWMQGGLDDVRDSGEWLQCLASRLHPDIVHLNGFAHGSLAWPSPAVVVAHSCVCSWWLAVHGTAAPEEWNGYRQAVTAGLRSADQVVAVSQATLCAIESSYGNLPHAQVIWNGRGMPCSHDRMRAKLPFIFSSGRLWDQAKNLEALRKAAHGVSWRIYVGGQTHSPDGVEVWASPLHTLGMLTEAQVRLWLEEASIYALPALYEPFGFSPLEAALSGCALLLGRIDSLQEVWGEAAWFADPRDIQEIAFRLNRLIEDPPARSGLAGRGAARARFLNPQRMAARYMEVYLEAARRKQSRQQEEHISCAS